MGAGAQQATRADPSSGPCFSAILPDHLGSSAFLAHCEEGAEQPTQPLSPATAFPSPTEGTGPGVPDSPVQREEAPGLPPNPMASCFAAHKALKAGRSRTSKAPGSSLC